MEICVPPVEEKPMNDSQLNDHVNVTALMAAVRLKAVRQVREISKTKSAMPAHAFVSCYVCRSPR
jgi:hypothetical protein